MSSGTKILLAVIALFVGILVVYYGFVMPPAEPGAAVVTDPATVAAAPEAPPPAVSMAPREESEVPAPVSAPRERAPARDSAGGAGAETPPLLVEPAAGVAATGTSGGAVRLPALRTARLTREERSAEGAGAALAREADPPPTAAAPAIPPPPAYTMYLVQEGDTMSSIAARWFGDQNKWDLIAKANLVDPNRLRVGQRLRLPPKSATKDPPRRAATGTQVEYVVRAGDTLTGIARAFYGDALRWTVIHEANRDAIGTDPHRLVVGMKLRIPPV